MNFALKSKIKKGGFSLVEVLIALGIFSVIWISLLTVLSLSMKNFQVSYQQTEALHLIEGVIEDFRLAPRDSEVTPIFKLKPGFWGRLPSTGRAWFDSSLNVSQGEGKFSDVAYEIEWKMVASSGVENEDLVEGFFLIRWPARGKGESSQESNLGGEITMSTTFGFHPQTALGGKPK